MGRSHHTCHISTSVDTSWWIRLFRWEHLEWFHEVSPSRRMRIKDMMIIYRDNNLMKDMNRTTSVEIGLMIQTNYNVTSMWSTMKHTNTNNHHWLGLAQGGGRHGIEYKITGKIQSHRFDQSSWCLATSDRWKRQTKTTHMSWCGRNNLEILSEKH